MSYNNNMKILVIEDEHKIANAIKRGLSQENYAVDIEYDGDSGLSTALAQEYDLIILDRMLPGLVDGIAVCKQLRQKNNHTPILFLTAKDQVRDRVAGLDAGADDYLVKPFAFEELLARVRALLRRPLDNTGVVLNVDNVSLDTVNFSVKRGKTPINLSKREYALLEFLMRNHGHIVTKDAIINHVWDFDADILPNTVEVYIGYLRSKLEKAFPNSKLLIHTARGFGYRFGDQ